MLILAQFMGGGGLRNNLIGRYENMAAEQRVGCLFILRIRFY